MIPHGKMTKHDEHHKQERRGQPFPSRSPQDSNEQTRKHDKKGINNTNDPKKKYRLGTVCKNILLEGFSQFHGANLTLHSYVDQDTFWKVTQHKKENTTRTTAKRSALSQHEGLDGGLVFTYHKKFSPLFISLKVWVIH